MRALAFTIWMNDLISLRMWHDYYKQYFDHLHVYLFNTKKENYKYLEKIGVTYDKWENENWDPFGFNKKLVELQAAYTEKYDWVLYSNCDEFIVPHPKWAKNLREFMEKSKKDWTACVGYEIIQRNREGPIDYSKPILKQRTHWVRNRTYNKVLLSKVPLQWVQGQHKLDGWDDNKSRAISNTGLYLIHTKHADWSIYSNPHRDWEEKAKPKPEAFVEKAVEEKKYRRIPEWAKVI